MSWNRRSFLSATIRASVGASYDLGPLARHLSVARSSNSPPANSANGSDERGKLDVGLFLDVEDVFSPAEVGNDDSVKELASILTEEGLRANFMVIAERAELLRDRNRTDVVGSLLPHEIGLHTRTAKHPGSSEYTAGKTWDAGVAEALKHEREGVDILEGIFQKPCVALSGHATFDTPHNQRAAAILKLPYVYAYPAAPPRYSLSWYVGALGIPFNSPRLDSQPNHSAFGGFDDVLTSPATFDRRLQELDALIDACIAEGQSYLTLFVGHPQKVRLMDFIDLSWSSNGHNLPPSLWGTYGTPRRRRPEEVKTILLNFRRMARAIRRDRRLNVLTVPEAVRKYGQQPAMITREDLIEAARSTASSSEILIHPSFSPAEIAVGFARAVLDHSQSRHLPVAVPRVNVLGPLETPIQVPEMQSCSYTLLLQHAATVMECVSSTGHLPANLGTLPQRLGVNHVYHGLAEAVLVLGDGSIPEKVTVARMLPWPAIGAELGLTFLKQFDGPLMQPDLDVNTIYRDSRLQSWTLKPAVG